MKYNVLSFDPALKEFHTSSWAYNHDIRYTARMVRQYSREDRGWKLLKRGSYLADLDKPRCLLLLVSVEKAQP